MTFEEFEKADARKLREMAKEVFDLSQHPFIANEAKPSHLLEAQSYLSEIDRRQADVERQEDWRIASRSHRIELIIIGLIGLEIIIALVAIWLGFKEGKEQAVILERIEKAATRAGNMNMVRP
jgi:hypothetical protein